MLSVEVREVQTWFGSKFTHHALGTFLDTGDTIVDNMNKVSTPIEFLL